MLSSSTYYVRRTLHTTVSNLVRKAGRRANPGSAYQLASLEDDEEQNLTRDPEGFGNLESDFMKVHRTHREHEHEVLQQRDKVRQLMIKHKYFRDQRLPNMLTYAEKEQIRLLHARDPEEWTVERLAESFPATPQIVLKILEAKWRPRSHKRIREHDEAVISNWEKLRAGADTLQLPHELRAHLQKFAARNMEDLRQTRAEELPIRAPIPQPQGKEFLSIITSCNKYAEQTNKQQEVAKLKAGKKAAVQLPPAADPEDETYLLEKVVDKRKMRLEELKRLKLTAADLAVSRNVSNEPTSAPETMLDKQAVDKLSNPGGTGIVARNPFANTQLPAEMNYAQKFESNEIVVSAEDQRRFEMTSVKDRIHIPRKLRRQGATYRVEDCYYDDDGEFLYRVPGMTGGAN